MLIRRGLESPGAFVLCGRAQRYAEAIQLTRSARARHRNPRSPTNPRPRLRRRRRPCQCPVRLKLLRAFLARAKAEALLRASFSRGRPRRALRVSVQRSARRREAAALESGTEPRPYSSNRDSLSCDRVRIQRAATVLSRDRKKGAVSPLSRFLENWDAGRTEHPQPRFLAHLPARYRNRRRARITAPPWTCSLAIFRSVSPDEANQARALNNRRSPTTARLPRQVGRNPRRPDDAAAQKTSTRRKLAQPRRGIWEVLRAAHPGPIPHHMAPHYLLHAIPLAASLHHALKVVERVCTARSHPGPARDLGRVMCARIRSERRTAGLSESANRKHTRA